MASLQCHPHRRSNSPQMTPLFFITHYQLSSMSHQLSDEYWDSLEPNCPFLCENFHNQFQLVAQLQVTNNDLQTQVMDSPDDVANVASQTASAVAPYHPRQHTDIGQRPADQECQGI